MVGDWGRGSGICVAARRLSACLRRFETLVSIAHSCQVSLDWLLGLSQDEGISSPRRETLEIAQGEDHSKLTQWYAEVSGSKIRYMPAGIPDQLCLPEVMEYSTAILNPPAGMAPPKEFQLNSSRAAESDIKCGMPMQTRQIFDAGEGIGAQISPVSV